MCLSNPVLLITNFKKKVYTINNVQLLLFMLPEQPFYHQLITIRTQPGKMS